MGSNREKGLCLFVREGSKKDTARSLPVVDSAVVPASCAVRPANYIFPRNGRVLCVLIHKQIYTPYKTPLLFIMKFLLPALCLVVAPVATTALPGSLLRRHLADVSETCLSETQALLETSGVSQAYTALEAAVATAGSCTNDDTNNKARCTMDFQGLSQDYAQACETAGGRTVSLTAQLDCDLSTSATAMSGGFEFVYQTMVDCVSTSCDLENVQDKIDSDMETSQQTLETSQGALCTYQITDFEGGTAPTPATPTTPTTETTEAPNPAPTPSAATAGMGGVVASAAAVALTCWNVVV